MVPPEPEPEPAPAPAPAPETQPPAASSPTPEEADLTWEDKEDKLDAENIQPEPPKPNATDKKYQYKEGRSLNLNTFQCFSILTMTLSHLHWLAWVSCVSAHYVCFFENKGVAFYLMVLLLMCIQWDTVTFKQLRWVVGHGS